MGTFEHPITLTAANGESETINGLVDTGATFSTVSRSTLRRLGVTPFARIRLRLADGNSTEAEVGEVTAQILGMPPRTIICVFGENGAPPSIGAHALEAFLLGVDPDQKRLVPLEAWWARNA
ncbi:MAG TPA: aspartyl protease family protein [Dehalococcoidia bacterium]|nr:aspartyl protease family protein [Dehalococcoidia bacterium]